MQEKHASLSIRHWSIEDRPREKLRIKGRSALTNAELLAILLRSGSRQETAVELAKKILYEAGDNLSVLGKYSVEKLMRYKGVGEAKAITLVAALELGRRKSASRTTSPGKIQNSSEVYDLLLPVLGDLPHEEFWIVYLNNANRVILKEQLSKGGITGTLVDIRLAMKKALDLSAVSIILAHNHPSGVTNPSQSDVDITKKLTIAAKTLDIKVLDHLIISRESFFSFADNNLMA